MTVVAVVGAQWGDEGKGKVVDLYTAKAAVVARYGGGANAGHTLVVGGHKLVVHLLPSGVLSPSTVNVLGQGMVIDPAVLVDEIDAVSLTRPLGPDRLLVSERAHVVLPHHKLVDGLRESAAGSAAIGTTKRGIGPAYEEKAARRGVRVRDLRDATRLRDLVDRSIAAWAPTIETFGGKPPHVGETVEALLAHGARIARFVGDAGRVVDDAIRARKHVLLEGAQGVLLDLDHGTYPFVTSSTTVAGGACSGIGIGPRSVGVVVGIAKAYATRVGGGPFPTEIEGDEGETIRKVGQEYGATTGRPRRCGWLDVPALRYAARVSGIDALAITKLDVLTGRTQLPVCVAYELDGVTTQELPIDDLDRARPVYQEVDGWSDPLDGARTMNDLPAAARRYVELIASLTGLRIALVSVSPERDATVHGWDPFG